MRTRSRMSVPTSSRISSSAGPTISNSNKANAVWSMPLAGKNPVCIGAILLARLGKLSRPPRQDSHALFLTAPGMPAKRTVHSAPSCRLDRNPGMYGNSKRRMAGSLSTANRPSLCRIASHELSTRISAACGRKTEHCLGPPGERFPSGHPTAPQRIQRDYFDGGVSAGKTFAHPCRSGCLDPPVLPHAAGTCKR